MAFEFQVQPGNPMQTVSAIAHLEDSAARRDNQKSALALRYQEAAQKMDDRKRARAQEGVDGAAQIAGAAQNAQEWDAGFKGLVDRGFTEFADEIGKYTPSRAQFTLRRAQDAKTLFAASPEQRAAKTQQAVDEATALHPLRMAERAAGKTTVSVNAPAQQQLVPKIGSDGKIIGFEMAAATPSGGKSGAKPPDPSGLGAPAAGKLEEAAIEGSNRTARLDQVMASFNPRFLQIAPRLTAAMSAGKEKLGMGVDPADKKDLEDFTKFRRDTTENLNITIKDLTGSAMGVQEAERIISTMPNAGTGIFDGDSPTQFVAKAQGAVAATKAAVARANWARRMNVDPLKTGIELSEVPALIDRRAAEIEKEVRAANPNYDDQAVRQQTKTRVGREFGLYR